MARCMSRRSPLWPAHAPGPPVRICGVGASARLPRWLPRGFRAKPRKNRPGPAVLAVCGSVALAGRGFRAAFRVGFRAAAAWLRRPLHNRTQRRNKPRGSARAGEPSPEPSGWPPRRSQPEINCAFSGKCFGRKLVFCEAELPGRIGTMHLAWAKSQYSESHALTTEL